MKFLVVGIINSLFWYLIFSLFIFMDISYVLAVLFATIFGVLFNFKSFGVLVFKSNDNKLLLKFVLVYVFIYIFNIIFLYFLEFFGSTNMYLNGMIIVPFSAILSFNLNKTYVFYNEKVKDE
jgi:putative flippase GtrA